LIASGSQSELRVAVVGLGLIGRRRAEALERVVGARLAATVDPMAANGALTAGVPHFASLAELRDDDYDAAVVAVPHDQATCVAAQVLSAGRPVLIEKPLGVCGTDARKLEKLAEKLARPSFVGYNYRYLPAIRDLMRCLELGDLGELRSVDMCLGHGGHPDSATSWKLDPIRSGGGVLLDPGVHLLDLLVRLIPSAECTAIEATRGFWATGIEEDVVAVFRARRAVAVIRTSHIRWINTFRVEVFGENGYAIVEGRGGNYGPMRLRTGRRWAWTSGSATVSQRGSEVRCDYGSRDDSLRDELAQVVALWRGEEMPTGQPQPATVSEARNITELCERLYRRLA
jgi:predicted dehydrogenase